MTASAALMNAPLPAATRAVPRSPRASLRRSVRRCAHSPPITSARRRADQARRDGEPVRVVGGDARVGWRARWPTCRSTAIRTARGDAVKAALARSLPLSRRRVAGARQRLRRADPAADDGDRRTGRLRRWRPNRRSSCTGSNAQYANVRYVGVPLRPDFTLDADAMLAAIERERPALVWLAYPNNPTGNRFAPAAIERILARGARTRRRRRGVLRVRRRLVPAARARFRQPGRRAHRVEDRPGGPAARVCGRASRVDRTDRQGAAALQRQCADAGGGAGHPRGGGRARREQAATIRPSATPRAAAFGRAGRRRRLPDRDELRARARARRRRVVRRRCATRASWSRTSTAIIR